MTTTTLDKLVHSANQAAQYFESQPAGDPAAPTRDHLRAYWDPRMRRLIYAHLDAGGAGLRPSAAEAIRRMREGDTAAA
ncbi:MAG TPA: formate dehydrogenase subunit delta [Caulobacteraceae bacterium]|nr:formate dehydrogenase subunit delta [Caulobacteraceae bacterium]